MTTHIWPLARDCRHITTFLREKVAVQKDAWRLNFYPCSATLVDGTFLPCVSVYSLREVANLRRKMSMERGLAAQIESPTFWVQQGSNVSVFNIQSVAKSRFALSERIYSKFSLMGEVAMSWNACSAAMKDGTELVLGSSGVYPFYDFPEPFSGEDIVSIRGIGRDAKPSALGRISFDVFVTWPEEEQGLP